MDGWLIMVCWCEIQWAPQSLWCHLHNWVTTRIFAKNAAAKQDLSQLSLHVYQVYRVQLRSPLAEEGRFGDKGKGEGRNVWDAERKTGRWETNFTKLERGKSWHFQVQSEPGYFLPKRRPLAEMNYTEPYITTGFATDGEKKWEKKKKPSKSPCCLQQHCHCSGEWQLGSSSSHTETHKFTQSQM